MPNKPTEIRYAKMVVPQGVGDIVWCYQLLKPHADRITFQVIDTPGTPRTINRRAELTIGALPGVTLEYVPFPDDAPRDWITQPFPFVPALAKARKGETISWCCNGWLEASVPLEKIDPTTAVAWDLGVIPKPAHGLTAGKYLAVYVSGDAVRHRTLGEKVWSEDEWVRFVDRVAYRHGVGTRVPVVLLGSSFDYPVTASIADQLRRKGFKVTTETDVPLAELFWILHNAASFLGYQSGLNVFAEAAGCPHQAIVYFPRLTGLLDNWVRPDRRKPSVFQYFYFNEDCDHVANRIWSDALHQAGRR